MGGHAQKLALLMIELAQVALIMDILHHQLLEQLVIERMIVDLGLELEHGLQDGPLGPLPPGPCFK